MHNNLGTVTGSSFLNIQDLAPGDTGRGAAGRGGTATSVIVVAVVSCVLGTSAVWLAIIWYVRARARARRRDWAGELEVKDAETPTTAAPLLGILGTVIGIIQSFQLLGTQSTLTDPREVAGGIAAALLTTAFGLIVALVTLFPYMLFKGQSNRAVGRMETLIASAQHGAEQGVPRT